MGQNPVDQMIDQVLACLAEGNRAEIGKLVAGLARQWPDEPALSLAFAMTCAASNLEDVIRDARSAKTAAFAFKLAALLSADIHAIQAMGQVPAKGADLLHFWRRVDPYFLDLAK